ncbi:DUF3180 domain-containing protein [Cryobacterium sp. TMT1-2-1]|uniref:DUF3180 domain-containing protein n=1 Tax=Cryobacterium sp. TMT1-2-1 TaxID=1259232 RepID=UPI00106AF638|nr:DUF3180 domain-containing protein [Cryobacterium sp. TMT1-2-1]TFD44331.1 DUF3180 domain-containing protein [Cryobacterium sp. TMT1-2-1]
MKRSSPTPLIALWLLGSVVGFLLEVTAAASGAPILLPPPSMAATLAVIGIVVVVLAWPIRQATKATKATKGTVKRRVDPFRAMRVAVLAKSSSFSGSLFLGGGLGVLLYVLTRTVVPNLSSLWLAIGTTVGAAILLAGGLVAEHFCTLPPDKPEDERQEEAGGLHA